MAVAIEAFGVERLMFGSNWPVTTLAGTYERVWRESLSAFHALGLSEAERAALLSTTAEQVYGLAPPS